MRRLSVLVAATVLAALSVPPAAAAGGATVRGKVVNGTTKDAVPHIDVILEQGNTETQTPGDKRSTTTDDAGNFEFTGVDGGSPWAYDIAVRYKGETYYTSQLNPGENDTVNTTATIWDPVSSPKNVTISQWVIFVEKDDQGLAIEQDVAYNNAGDKAYTGSQKLQTGDSVTVELPVTPGALSNTFQYDGILLECCPTVGTDTLVHTTPILPGKSMGVVRYATPIPESLVFPITLPTDQVAVLAGEGVDLTPSDLTSGGTQTVDGKQYTVYTASNLGIGSKPAVGVASGGGNGPATPVLAIVLLAVAGLGALLLIAVRLRPTAKKPQTAGGPKRMPQQAKRRAPRQRKPSESYRGAAADSELEADLLIAEIAALDLSFEQGLMKEEDYQVLRATRKAELLRIKREAGG